MVKTRINRFGLVFQLIEEDDKTTHIQLIDKTGKVKDSIKVKAHIEQLSQSWYFWMNGDYVQSAFPYLNNDEREFIMTGLTPLEFEEATRELTDDEG